MITHAFKKRITLSLLCPLFMSGAMTARQLTPDEALDRAGSAASSTIKTLSVRNVEPNLIKTVRTQAGTPAIYMFNVPETGCLILSADDAIVPMLGYTDKTIDPANMPDGMRIWLDDISSEIQYALANGTRSQKPSSLGSPIDPLIKSTWGQTGYYNIYTPVVSGRQSPSGCVATALAQIMYYYKWPAAPVGEASCSDTSGETHSMTFDGITFEWDKMTPYYDESSTQESIEAVSTLMKCVGYSVSMSYGSYSSGANSNDALKGMIENMGYSQNVSYVRREAFLRQEWEEMLYTMLANGQPVYHTGRDAVWLGSGGHAFVCDGYDGDGYFHFNWGWDGSYNGYFLTSCLVPEGAGTGGYINGYNYSQEVLVNLYPDDSRQHGGYDYVAGSNFYYDDFSKTIHAHYERTPFTAETYEAGISLTPVGETGKNVIAVASIQGTGDVSKIIDETVTAGLDTSKDYELRMEWKKPETGIWERVIPPTTGFLLYDSAVMGGVLSHDGTEWTFTTQVVDRDSYDVTVNDILFNSGNYLFIGEKNKMQFNITNNEDDYFYHAVRLYFIDVATGQEPKFFNLSLEIGPGETNDKTYTLTALSGIDEGEYYLRLTEANTGEEIWSDRSKTYSVIERSTLRQIDDGTFVYSLLPSNELTVVGTLTGNPVGGEVKFPAELEVEGNMLPVVNISANITELIAVNEVTSLVIETPMIEIPSFWINYSTSLLNIELPEGLKKIDQYAFYDCDKVVTLKLPSTLEVIEYSAFSNFSSLKNLQLPASLKLIDSYSFSNCTALESLTLPALEIIPNYAFSNCNNLTRIELPETVKSIGRYAFSYCKSLQTLSIPEGVETIDEGAFTSCNKLRELSLPSTLKSIGTRAFYSYSFNTEAPKETIKVAAIEPPLINPDTFSDNDYNETKLIVAQGASLKYKADSEGWGKFFNINEEEESSSISGIVDNTGYNGAEAWYTLSGVLLPGKPHTHGIYLRVRNGKGTTVKL